VSPSRFSAPARAWGFWALSWLRPAAVFYLGPLEPVQAFEAWCGAHPGVAVRLVVSGHWTYQMIVNAPSQSTVKLGLSMRTARAVQQRAAQDWARHFGDAAQDWPLATWHGEGLEGSCVLHGVDLSALRRCASLHGVRLLGVMPLWAALLPWMDVAEPDWSLPAVVAVVEGTLLTWVACDLNGAREVLQRRLAEPSVVALDQKIDQMSQPNQRVCVVGFGLEVMSGLNPQKHAHKWKAFTALDSSVLPGHVLQNLPPKTKRRWPQPDLSRTPGDGSAWARVAVVLAWLAFGCALAFFIPSRDALDRAQLDFDGAQTGLQSARTAYRAASAPAQTGRSAGADTLAALRAQARKVHAGLHQAWGGVLLPIESVANRDVRWLELDFAADGERVRLAGQASDTDAALEAVRALSMQPGWSQVVLSKIQEGLGRDPALNLRFELTAAYRNPSAQTLDEPGR